MWKPCDDFLYYAATSVIIYPTCPQNSTTSWIVNEEYTIHMDWGTQQGIWRTEIHYHRSKRHAVSSKLELKFWSRHRCKQSCLRSNAATDEKKMSNMSKHVRNWIRCCPQCIRFKPITPTHGPMQIHMYQRLFHICWVLTMLENFLF